MTKYADNAVLDAPLLAIASRASRLVALSAPVTAYTGIAAATLGSCPMEAADFSPPVDDPIAGRRMNVAAKEIVSSAGGGLNHHALVDDALGVVLWLTEVANDQAVITGRMLRFAAWSISFRPPV